MRGGPLNSLIYYSFRPSAKWDTSARQSSYYCNFRPWSTEDRIWQMKRPSECSHVCPSLSPTDKPSSTVRVGRSTRCMKRGPVGSRNVLSKWRPDEHLRCNAKEWWCPGSTSVYKACPRKDRSCGTQRRMKCFPDHDHASQQQPSAGAPECIASDIYQRRYTG